MPCTDEELAICCDPTNHNPTQDMLDACLANNCNWMINSRGSPFCSGTDFESCVESCTGTTPETTTTTPCTNVEIAACCDPTSTIVTQERLEACAEYNCNWVIDRRGNAFCSGSDYESCISSCVGKMTVFVLHVFFILRTT